MWSNGNLKKIQLFWKKGIIRLCNSVITRLASFRRRFISQPKKFLPKPNRNPVVVYQMGRVGSSSVRDSLEQAYNTFCSRPIILHGHYLENFEKIEIRAKKDFRSQGLSQADHRFYKSFNRLPKDRRIKLVSLVRDPVARNVSTFFYALDEFAPDWEERCRQKTLSIDFLQQVFLDKRNYTLSAFYWFDEQLAPVFNINVYESPFPHEKGYKIYSSSKADLLLLRLENLKDCAKEAIDEFLQIPDFELLKTNTGENRKTGGLYKLFKNEPLPREYVEWSYEFRLAQHFYTKEELEKFIAKWT